MPPARQHEQEPNQGGSFDHSSQRKNGKACIACRKSKVRCEVVDQLPCRRCKAHNYECKFQQDEDVAWRKRTEDTLSRLTSVIEGLITYRGTLDAEQQPPVARTTEDPQTNHPSSRHPSDSHPVEGSSQRGSSSSPSFASPNPLNRSRYHPYAAAGVQDQSPSNPNHIRELRETSSTSANWGDAMDTSSPEASSLLLASGSASRSRYVASELNANGSENPAPPPASLAPVSTLAPTSSFEDPLARFEGVNARSCPPPDPIPSDHQIHESSPTREATMQAPSFTHVSSSIPSPRILRRAADLPEVPRKRFHSNVVDRHSPYQHPDPRLGQEDPRLNVIRLGILSMHQARSLLVTYAREVQPFGFGFPDFPASPNLTPVLLSAITAAACLHSTPLVHKRRALRNDVLERACVDQVFELQNALDPESGIGVEEVIGAAVMVSYDGGETSWKLSRVARWWSERMPYERVPTSGLTVGEMVAILPPLRQISMLDRVRVWLSAYLVEAHQSLMLDRPTIEPEADPYQCCSLLLKKVKSASYPSSVSTAKGEVSHQDLVLCAHAKLACILLHAREAQRLFSDRFQEGHDQVGLSSGSETPRDAFEITSPSSHASSSRPRHTPSISSSAGIRETDPLASVMGGDRGGGEKEKEDDEEQEEEERVSAGKRRPDWSEMSRNVEAWHLETRWYLSRSPRGEDEKDPSIACLELCHHLAASYVNSTSIELYPSNRANNWERDPTFSRESLEESLRLSRSIETLKVSSLAAIKMVNPRNGRGKEGKDKGVGRGSLELCKSLAKLPSFLVFLLIQSASLLLRFVNLREYTLSDYEVDEMVQEVSDFVEGLENQIQDSCSSLNNNNNNNNNNNKPRRRDSGVVGQDRDAGMEFPCHHSNVVDHPALTSLLALREALDATLAAL
ncbi:hypothetical protein IE53DRAFT_83228 [Violaceomyces palustris]|uniref:Uncharacterized protein n=1 Tax=Violaceomyces palustris TaxID=1673888 RepID=A0ACD0NY00_9BASI|nr:hypothetical protein IE53DRAFT_83228 [Violaceomyces palustris]